tara:strand:+ start:176 stop:550 length:375 start_codon:yes stop_codon:yes gene_type:complete
MRVIDSKISAMILKGLNKEKFDRKLSKRDRVVSDGTGKVSVFLWKTEIAEFDPYVNEIIVKDGGHQTVTTKSRINAILSGWAQGNPGISQRKWVWYIDEVCPLTRDRKSKKFQGVASFPMKHWR